MVNYRFYVASPDEIEANPQAISYLERGAKDFGGLLSVKKCLNDCRSGLGKCILIKNATLLRGAAYLTFTQQETGKVMTSVLLGGDDFHEWASGLREFYYKLARENCCDEFSLMGRRGFKRYFSELSEVATVFRVILNGDSKNIK